MTKCEIAFPGKGDCVKTKNYTFPEDRFTQLRSGFPLSRGIMFKVVSLKIVL